MNKIVLLVSFCIAAFGIACFSQPVVHADPAPNTTSLFLILPKDMTKTMTVPGDLYMPWPAVITLLDEKVTNSGDPANIDFSKYTAQYDAYIQKHMQLTNNGVPCVLKVTGVPNQSQDSIYLGLGVQLHMLFTCEKPLDALVLKNDLFSDVPMQQNTVQISKETQDALIQVVILTPEVTEMQIGNAKDTNVNPSANTVQPTVPSQTNTLMNQLTAKLTTVPFVVMLLLVFTLGFLHTAEAGHSKTILSAAMIDKKVDFKQAVAFSAVFTATHVADIVLMGLVLLVANSFIDVFSKLPYLQIFSLYALAFVSLYMLLQSIAHFIQTKFQKKSVIKGPMHAHITGGLIDSHLSDAEHTHGGHTHSHGTSSADHDHFEEFLAARKKGDFKHQLLMGVIAGIAPCLFGWSIFMVVLSTHSVWTVFPVIGMFALGIFAALLLFAVIITKLKSTVFAKASWLGELSPIISAGILFGYAVMMLV